MKELFHLLCAILASVIIAWIAYISFSYNTTERKAPVTSLSLNSLELVICDLKDECNLMNPEAATLAVHYDETKDDKDGQFIRRELVQNIFGFCHSKKEGEICMDAAIAYPPLEKNTINTIAFITLPDMKSSASTFKASEVGSQKELLYIFYKKDNSRYLMEAYINYGGKFSDIRDQRMLLIQQLTKLTK